MWFLNLVVLSIVLSKLVINSTNITTNVTTYQKILILFFSKYK